MRLTEQDIMNAICLHIASRKQIPPEQVEVQLMYDDDLGYSAEVITEGRSQFLVQASMLEAIERYLFTEHGMRVYREQIQLDIDDEMFAVVTD